LLRSLFGAVEIRAPRFEPCQCSVTLRTAISPVTEIMPDRCTPEYERVLATFGAPVTARSIGTTSTMRSLSVILTRQSSYRRVPRLCWRPSET
jgi:hypothetical protein